MAKKILVGLSVEDLELIILALEMAMNHYRSWGLPLMIEKMGKQLDNMRKAKHELEEKGE